MPVGSCFPGDVPLTQKELRRPVAGFQADQPPTLRALRQARPTLLDAPARGSSSWDLQSQERSSHGPLLYNAVALLVKKHPHIKREGEACPTTLLWT